MYQRTLTYTDYNGVVKTEDFYFNLTKAELVEMQLSYEGGMDVLLDKIAKTQNKRQLIKYFKKTVLMSYGEKTEDGRFLKSDAIREKFESTAAYSEIFMSLVNDDKAAADFINGIMPKDLVEKTQKESPEIKLLNS